MTGLFKEIFGIVLIIIGFFLGYFALEKMDDNKVIPGTIMAVGSVIAGAIIIANIKKEE